MLGEEKDLFKPDLGASDSDFNRVLVVEGVNCLTGEPGNNHGK